MTRLQGALDFPKTGTAGNEKSFHGKNISNILWYEKKLQYFLVPTFSTWDLCSFQRNWIWLILRKGITQSHRSMRLVIPNFSPGIHLNIFLMILSPKHLQWVIYIYGFIFSSPPPRRNILYVISILIILTPSQVTSVFLGSYGIPTCSFPTSVDSTLSVTTIRRSSTACDARLEKTTGEVPTNKKPAIYYKWSEMIYFLFQTCLFL